MFDARRINRLLTYSNDDELIYDIVRVPANAQIAAIEDTNGDETYLLTVPGRKAPITIWLIGTITRAYFRDRDGNLPKSISVNVRALHESSLNAANNLLRTFTTFGPGAFLLFSFLGSMLMDVQARIPSVMTQFAPVVG